MDEVKLNEFEPVQTHEDSDDERPSSSKSDKLPFKFKVLLGVLAGLAIFFFVAFSVLVSRTPTKALTASGPCVSSDCVLLASRVLDALDTSVKPCDDFFQYACKAWREKNPIPDDKASYSVFTWLKSKNDELIRGLLPNASSSTFTSVVKAARLYSACMDVDAIDERGNTPIVAMYEGLGSAFSSVGTPWAADDATELASVLGRMHLNGSSILFSTGVGGDDMNASRNAVFLWQSAIKLPDRDYYFKNASDDVIVAYIAYTAKLFELVGVPKEEAAQKAQRIFDLEKQFANVTVPNDESRDPVALYNLRNMSGLAEDCSAVDWNKYFATILGGVVPQTAVSTAPTFFRGLADVLKQTNKSTIVEYLQSSLLSSMSNYLSKPFRDNKFEFNKVLMGVEQPPDRWRTCLEVVNGPLGYAVGKLFVDKQFSKEAKQLATSLLDGVLSAFSQSFGSLSWMDKNTSSEAVAKSKQFTRKIGYPAMYDTPGGLDDYYVNLTVPEGKYFEGVHACNQWATQKNFRDLFSPPDRSRWDMNPQDVNAYYNPNMNEIVFPAGILQPPFFSTAYQAISYGGIGMVMGHEISHGFDDSGSKYDGTGVLRGWWTNASLTKFAEKTTCMANQYSKFTVRGPDGEEIHINGNLTLGENIADNGGIRAAYDAYQSWTAAHSREPQLPGLEHSPQQLFFLGAAQVWCGNRRPNVERLAALTDPHSTNQVRVNGIAMNSPHFAEAFNCPVGSPMNPAAKCVIW